MGSSPSRGVCCLLFLALLACLVPATTYSQTEASEPTAVASGSVQWLDFTPVAFRRALAEDRLIMLVLDVPWSSQTGRADREVWSDPAVQKVIRDHFVPVRERGDLRIDLMRRYPAEGWPGISILLPNGSSMYFQGEEGQTRRVTSGFAPAVNMAAFLSNIASFYETNREQVWRLASDQVENMTTTAKPESGSLSEYMVWGIGQKGQSSFDREKRYFGGAPRLPRFDLIEMSMTLGSEQGDPWTTMGTASLTTLTKNLIDEDGGLQRMALGLDWEDPQSEKLLDRNARILELMTLGYRITGKRSYRDDAMKTARFVVDRLSNSDGSFANAVCDSCENGRDAAVISASNGAMAAAMIRAGAVFGETELKQRGLKAVEFLAKSRFQPGFGVARSIVDGVAVPPESPVLDDQVDTIWAFIAAYEATGSQTWLKAADELTRTALANLRDRQEGVMKDIINQPQAPTSMRVPLYPLRSNARFVRSLIRLFYLTEARDLRDAARDILKGYSGSYERSPLETAAFGLAVYEFHFPPLTAHIVSRQGDESADKLRAAAMSAEFPFTIVRTWDVESQSQDIKQIGFNITPTAGLYAYYGGLRSPRVSDPLVVRGKLALLRDDVVANRKPREKGVGEAEGGN